MNAFSYIRVSTRKQVDGDGPERQREAIYNFSTAHNLTVVEEFEESVSGTADAEGRPVLMGMLDKLKVFKANGRPVEAIIVERMDRLARDLIVGEVLMRDLTSRGIKLFCADRGELEDVANDCADPTRILIRQILGALAQWDKTQLVRKMRLARERMKANGRKRVEGALPFGKNPGEQKIADFAISLFQMGHDNEQVAAELNKAGMRTRRGSLWNCRTVWRIRHDPPFNNRVPSPGCAIYRVGKRPHPNSGSFI